MSNNEKALTKGERQILKGLNIRAALILQLEKIFKEANISIDPESLHDLLEEDLLSLIETWSPGGQADLKKKYTTNT